LRVGSIFLQVLKVFTTGRLVEAVIGLRIEFMVVEGKLTVYFYGNEMSAFSS